MPTGSVSTVSRFGLRKLRLVGLGAILPVIGRSGWCRRLWTVAKLGVSDWVIEYFPLMLGRDVCDHHEVPHGTLVLLLNAPVASVDAFKRPVQRGVAF